MWHSHVLMLKMSPIFFSCAFYCCYLFHLSMNSFSTAEFVGAAAAYVGAADTYLGAADAIPTVVSK